MIWKRWNKREAKKNYRSRYLKKADTVARQGKLVYVRREYHERIRRIARVIGGDDVTLFSYIDNVLAEHFASTRRLSPRCTTNITILFFRRLWRRF